MSNEARETDQQRLNHDTIPGIWESLRGRARWLRRFGFSALVGATVCIAGGVALFVLAGQIAARDAKYWGPALTESGARTDVSIERIERKIRERSDDAPGRSPTPAEKPAEKSSSSVAAEVKAQRALIERLEDRVGNLGQLVMAVEAQANTNAVVSTLVTRAGAVLLLIFLVQILVSFSRYTFRMAIYLESRADALDLLRSDSDEALSALNAFFAPQSVDFGKPIGGPAEQVLALLKPGR